MKTNVVRRPFGIRDKMGYLFGDFGNDFTFIFSTMMLMKFYTDVMGVSAGVVGLVMTIARVVDAFTDITMGRICDRARPTEAGKFKPWLLRMCVPVALASFLIYQSALAGAEMWVKIAYLFVTYILWGSVFYTSINIPYGSMASAVSANPDDRQSLSTFRTMGAMLAGTIIGVLLPLIAYEKVDGAETLIGPRVTIAAGVFSVLAIGCYVLCYTLVTERVRPEQSNEKQDSVGQMLASALKNRASADHAEYERLRLSRLLQQCRGTVGFYSDDDGWYAAGSRFGQTHCQAHRQNGSQRYFQLVCRRRQCSFVLYPPGECLGLCRLPTAQLDWPGHVLDGDLGADYRRDRLFRAEKRQA